MGLDLQGLTLARRLYLQVQALDHGRGGRMGTQALLLALERANNIGPSAENQHEKMRPALARRPDGDHD